MNIRYYELLCRFCFKKKCREIKLEKKENIIKVLIHRSINFS